VKDDVDWRWGSAYRRYRGTTQEQNLLDTWRVSETKTYRAALNELQGDSVVEKIRTAITKGSPLGDDLWREKLIASLKLGHTVRSVGRPKSGS